MNTYIQVKWDQEDIFRNMIRLRTMKVVESYLRQYAVGKKSWLDVLNAQRESTQAKNTLVDYEVLYLTSLYRLRVLLNEINPKLLGV